MRIVIACVMVFSGLIAFQSSSAQELRLPAEWEPQQRVFLSWFGVLRRDSVTCRVIEALQPVVDVTLILWGDSIQHRVKKKLAAYDIDTNRIQFHVDAYESFWLRDFMVFVKEAGLVKMVCFDYNSFGELAGLPPEEVPEEVKLNGTLDERIADWLNIPKLHSHFVFEQGGIESNGNGTLMVIREMALQRNPGKTIPEIETELKRMLNANHIIWLKDGLAEDKKYLNGGPFFRNYFGGGANMHVDELARFVNDSTVVLPYIDSAEIHASPVDSLNYPMLNANYEILKQATTAEGTPIKIVRIPMPEVEGLKFTMQVDSQNYQQMRAHGFAVGDTIFRIPAASYCNFLISNSVVLIPKYWKPGMPESQRKKDEEVHAVFQALFPEKKIVAIYTHSINRGGGGIHCMTHEMPAAN